MRKDELQVVAFEIILYSGDSRTMIHEAFELMRRGKYEKAKEKLDKSNDELLKAHKSQTELLQMYACGDEEITMEIIMVHAQDHLMTTMTLRELAIEFLELYKQLQSIENRGA